MADWGRLRCELEAQQQLIGSDDEEQSQLVVGERPGMCMHAVGC
jgi:hypothetical protein